jgi:hypothetical protein
MTDDDPSRHAPTPYEPLADTPISGRPGPGTDADIGEADRRVTAQLIQQAVVAEVLPFDALDDRLDAIYSATTRAELDAVVADLPQPAPPAAPVAPHPAPSLSMSLIGDIKISGTVEVESTMTFFSLLGDVFIDLSAADLPTDVTITVFSLIGDATVVVADGNRAVLESVTVIGDRRSQLAEARAGTPTVRFRAFSLIGDVKLFSLSLLPEGSLRKLWRKLRQQS